MKTTHQTTGDPARQAGASPSAKNRKQANRKRSSGLRRGSVRARPTAPIEPFAVPLKEAMRLTGIRSRTKFYELIDRGEVDSFLDGGARMVTWESLKKRQERLLAAAKKKDVNRAVGAHRAKRARKKAATESEHDPRRP